MVMTRCEPCCGIRGWPSQWSLPSVSRGHGHWRQSVFGDELMTPAFTGNVHPLSRVTVASLADLGYVVNLAAADAYVAGQ